MKVADMYGATALRRSGYMLATASYVCSYELVQSTSNGCCASADREKGRTACCKQQAAVGAVLGANV